MIKILNQQLEPVSILENAYGIGYKREFNTLWTSSFSLPLNDEKNTECRPLNFVEVWDESEYIGLFRIIPALTLKNESNHSVQYHCEHVLATLLDDVMFLYHDVLDSATNSVLTYILNQQTTKYWKLGTVGFTRYFSYKWENENLLSALFSIPRPFNQEYQWTFDTQSYPWTLNLVQPESELACEIRYGKNLRGIEKEVDPTVIFNRIYPLGYGEGDNQLNIKSINNGIPYVEDTESIALYGLRSYIWSDKRYENVQNLKASAEGLLKAWKVPKITYRVNAADISSLTKEDIDKLRMGRLVRMIDEDLGTSEARILIEEKPDLKGAPFELHLEIANKTGDLATTQSDMERRQQINELYAQGATNLLAYSYNDNADQNNPAEIVFFLPDEMIKLNKLTLWYETKEFRTYGQATKGGGATSTTTSSGGGVSTSTASGGGTTQTSAAGGDHSHLMFNYVADNSGISNPKRDFTPQGGTNFRVTLEAASPSDLYTAGSSGNHSHSVSVPSHTHDFSVPNHSHDFSVPDHTHDIQHGIYKLTQLPTSVAIQVDGNAVPQTELSGENIDLIPYLSKDSDGRIVRGKHIISITPNDLGRINAQVNTQFFIQSRGEYSL